MLSIQGTQLRLFQECTTGAPSEYALIDQTFSPKALEEILKWVQMRMK